MERASEYLITAQRGSIQSPLSGSCTQAGRQASTTIYQLVINRINVNALLLLLLLRLSLILKGRRRNISSSLIN